MLVITRREGQSIQIGDGILVTVVRVDGRSVRLGIEAPMDAAVMRSELHKSAKDVAPPLDDRSSTSTR